MRVRLLQSFPGLRPGSFWDCDEAEAARLVEAGIAEHIEAPGPRLPDQVERAVAVEPEKATKPRGRRRRKAKADE